MLEDKLNNDLKEAMKAKDAIRLSAIRVLKSDIDIQSARNNKKLTDDEVLKTIQKQIKQRNDSIEQFRNGNRMDLVGKEEAELKILKAYVPEQLTADALEELVKSVIRETGAKDKKDMGRVIKSVIEKSGGRADGKAVSQAAAKLLQ